jgi:predicted transcriptional regulator
MLARSWQRVPIYEALLEQDGLHLPQTQRAAAALTSFRVSDAMTTELITLSIHDSVAAAVERIKGLEFSIYPVVDEAGLLKGLISEARLRRCLAEARGDSPLGNELRVETYLDNNLPLVEAVAKMNAQGARQMAVVASDSQRLVGMLAMSDVMRAHMHAAQGVSADDSPLEGLSARSAVSWKRRDSSTIVPQPGGGANRP